MPAPPRQPPGWYPDPGHRGMLRYWTGTTWTNRTAPMRPAPPLPPMPAAPLVPPASAPSAGPGPVKRGWGCLTSLGLGGLALLFAIVVAVVAISRGQEVKSVDASGKIEFYSAKGGEYSAEEIADRQTALEKELAEVKEQAESRAGTTNVAPPPVSLTGTWQGADGVAQYDLQQYGTYVVVQERTVYGITAVGQGTFDGQHLELSYQAFNYTTGQASLDLVDDRTLSGYFNNSVYGQSPATLRR